MQRLLQLLRRKSSFAPESFKGNEIQLYPQGELFFHALFTELAAANTSICLEYYIINADKTGARLAKELINAVARGVKVYLIYDYIGCLDTPASYFRQLSAEGINCLPFNPPTFKRGLRWFDRRDHRKLAIIDGVTAFLGGMNIGDEYAGFHPLKDRFHDVGFCIRGPAVDHVSMLFSETWRMERGVLPVIPSGCTPTSRSRRNDELSLIAGGPHQRRSAIRTAFRLAIASASTELLIANPYFLPGPVIVRSLLKAASRGVKIRLLLPARSDVPIVRLISRGSYAPLLEAGIEIFELERDLLHAKMMLIDGERTVLGSANLDQRSFHRNFEINAIIRSRQFGNQIKKLFEEDFLSSRQITLDSHQRRSWLARLVELALKPICWFL
jgi:cardiolipin synthase